MWRLADGVRVESVVMRYDARATVCVSSQAGCGMGCPFCATGQNGLVRNLSTAEIAVQVRAAAASLAAGEVGGSPAGVSNVVLMGMGEPLANWPRVGPALHRMVDAPPAGLGLAARHVTVSTVGRRPGMHRLAESGLQVTLAVSLHAPDDETRSQLVPLNTRWPVAEVLAAADAHVSGHGTPDVVRVRDARRAERRPGAGAAARVAAARPAGPREPDPLNPTPAAGRGPAATPTRAPSRAVLSDAGVPVSVRDTRGREVAGACGQPAGDERSPGTPAGPGLIDPGTAALARG